jgi:hypothetical protein
LAIRCGEGGSGQPAQFHRSRHPQPPGHRAEVEARARWGRTGRESRGVGHVPFDVVAALGVQRDAVARLPGQVARMRPGGDHHPAGVQMQPRAFDT